MGCRRVPTKDTPNVSHLANSRGKTVKSTARMASVVMRSMCALYIVSEGRGAIARGENVGLWGRSDGSGDAADSLGGMRRRGATGKRTRSERSIGLVANMVMERRRGKTRIRHDLRKPIGLEGGKRVMRVE